MSATVPDEKPAGRRLLVLLPLVVFLALAAISVLLVKDVADKNVPEAAVIAGDEEELLTLPESAQPVPSTGLIDEK